MNTINLSIIIPFYNDFENIDNALNSIFNQKTKLNYEIIIINNSEKKSLKSNYLRLLSLYNNRQKIRIINSDKKGAANARNIGIINSNGKYIMFLDSDDYFENNVLLKLENDILDNNYDMIKFCANRVENQETFDNIKGFNYETKTGIDMLIKLITFKERIFSPVWLYCINKKIFLDNNIWFTKNMFHEDYRIISNLLMFSKKSKSYDFIGYNYVHRKGSITRNNSYLITKKKSFDFIEHSNCLLKIGKKKLNKYDFIIFRDYIIEQTYRKYKYLNVSDKKKYYKKIINIEKKFKLINFSIIIPVYNSEKTIKRTIKSILNQNYKNYEIIIINDGCKDKSMKLINKYKFSKNVKIINQKNMGQSIARNNGIKNANGKYLIFLDSDDTFVKKTFSNLEIEVIKNQPDLIYSNIFNKISIETKKIDLNRSDDVAKNYILGSPCPYSKVFKKNIIEEFPKFDRYEDLAIIPLYILKTDKISKIDIAFYNYYKKEESIMHRNNKNFECLNESLLYLFEEIKKYDNFSIYRQEYEFLFIKNLLYFSLLRSYYTKEELKKYKIGLNMLKSNFPKWHENIYLKEQTKKFKKFVKLINLEKIEEAIKIFKTKGVKIK